LRVNEKVESELLEFKKEIEDKYSTSQFTDYNFPRLNTPKNNSDLKINKKYRHFEEIVGEEEDEVKAL
jgi:hypothetical protein